jgi:UDP-GlcNAc:undecaprenyl-phosphate/decaprenyl-phosphate GlcNAc-1-phosphate transferase
MYAIMLGFITAFSLTFLAIPAIIQVAKVKKLYDQPNQRSSHREPTPSLGGIAIFGGAICGIVLWTPVEAFGDLQYILGAMLIIFLIGMKDDMMPVSPTQKFSAQILAALILVYKAQVKLGSLHGIMGIHSLPEMIGFVLSIVAIVGIINAFNLIDGINGLAGGITLMACCLLGAWFFSTGHVAMAVVAFALAGAVVAFLKFNLTPAKIFMGDTGSLLVGTVCAVLVLKFVELHAKLPAGGDGIFEAPLAVALSLVILPVFDTLRVFARRMMQGRSPFSPDRTHIHHLMIDMGLSHVQATAILLGINLCFILLAASLGRMGTLPLLILMFTLAILSSMWLSRAVQHRKANVV